MKLSRTVSHNPALFSMIPLVNVLFLLLIFFALSTTYVLQPGIAVTLPYSSYNLAPQRNPQIVSILSAPSQAIYFHDQKVTLDELGKSLADSRIKNKVLIIKADRGTSWEMVMQITNKGIAQGYQVDYATNAPK
jgi:biopolymer transport protein ExbD